MLATLEYVHQFSKIRVILTITRIWLMVPVEKLQPRTLHNSLKEQGFAELIVLANYQSDFTHKVIV